MIPVSPASLLYPREMVVASGEVTISQLRYVYSLKGIPKSGDRVGCQVLLLRM